ncbi:MAG: type II TA system antitoxin MqsA family protein, partial [Candidatus Micrarchaeota archaeon]
MRCINCENKKALKSERVNIRYKESGLDNILLIGVERSRCDVCGEEYYRYGNILQLHDTIAHALLRKDGLLTGKEIKFLRKYLGYSGETFAKLSGYRADSIYKIENGQDRVTPAFDHFIRVIVASKHVDRNYDIHDIILSGKFEKFKRLELKSNKAGEWRIQKAA